MTALASAPLALLQKSQFLRPITKGLIDCNYSAPIMNSGIFGSSGKCILSGLVH